jgi:hypothetical protein
MTGQYRRFAGEFVVSLASRRGHRSECQQFTSQLHQREAAVHAALENLNLARRRVEALRAQRMSAGASRTSRPSSTNQVNLERTRFSPVDG